MAKDPICGMEVDERSAGFMVHYDHETFYFCSERCKETFEKERGFMEPPKKGGLWSRLLSWIAGGSKEEFGGKPPSCHGT